MRGIDGEHVDTGIHQLRGALQKVSRGADRTAHAEPALFVLAGVGIFQLLLDVLDGDQALKFVLVVDHQELLDAVLVQDLLRLFERGADRNRDEVLLGHHLADGDIGAGFKAQIAVGENAHQPLALRNRDAGDPVAAHHFESVTDHLVRPDGDRVHDHAAFRALHLIDLAGLGLDVQVAVDDADAAHLCHGDGHARFGDRVHRRGKQRRVQRDVAGELRLGAHLRGHHFAVRRHQQDVVKGESFRKSLGQHNTLMRLADQGSTHWIGRRFCLL